MGSGCTGRKPSDKCTVPVSSNCVLWQGDAIPSLGICPNDTLTEIEVVIAQKVIDYAAGVGISLPDITANCAFVTALLNGKDKALGTLIQVLFNAQCTLHDLITTVTDIVNTPIVYDGKCLTPATTDTKGFVQELINQVCTIKVDVASIISEIQNTSITTTVNNLAGDQILTAINSCGGNGIVKTGTGANASIMLIGMVPYYCPIFYDGPLSNFDTTGKGLPISGYCGWYICNGNNGTKDYRGYVLAGATTLSGIVSPSLDARVDPVSNGDPSIDSAIGDKKGLTRVKLSIAEIPSHGHSMVLAPHRHTLPIGGALNQDGNGGNSEKCPVNSRPGNIQSMDTSDVTLSGTISSTGGDTPHLNIQPTAYGVFIVRLP